MNDARLRAAYTGWLAQRVPQGREGCVRPEALLALARREGGEPERLATLDHAMSCALCRRDLELLRSLAVAGDDAGVASDRRTAPWQPRGFRLAASIALLALGGAAAVYLLRRGDPVYRGTPSAVVPVSPIGDVRQADAHRLVWRPVPGATRYSVELLLAGGQAVLSTTARDTFVEVPAETLQPGQDYLWTLRAALSDGTQTAAEPRRFRIIP